VSLTAFQTDKILHNAYNLLSREKNTINDLNVFPVPDGDTGLNMTLTIQTALNSLKKKDIETLCIREYLMNFANGMILNSRGCSGVILALFCKGIAESVKQSDHLNNISNSELSAAFRLGYELAYKETPSPCEGTMLTMMKVFANYFEKFTREKNSTPFSIIKKIIPILEKTLEKTPEMLPILKKAGVVDSGAMGFLVLIKGVALELEYNRSIIKPLMTTANILLISKYVRSFVTRKKSGKRNKLFKTIILNYQPKSITNFTLSNIIKMFNNLVQKKDNIKIAKAIIQKSEDLLESWSSNIQYRYCTEFIMEANHINKQNLKSQLNNWGDSLIIIESEDIYKIHIHTNKPKSLLKLCEAWGKITFTKVDDMKKQHHNLISQDKAYYDKDNAVLFIVNGDGFAEILKGLGATDILIYKKVKPSVNQVQNAIIKTRAKNVIIAADNTDILPSLKSAITLCKSNIELIETGSIIQLISMMYNYSDSFDVMQNANIMRDNLDNVKFCKIARATRSFNEDLIFMEKGDFFTIYNNKIILSSKNIQDILIQSINKLKGEESLISLYCAEMGKNKSEILYLMQSTFRNISFETYYGGQNKFNYYITFE
jgi:dihydroxyacetone kinase-like predicted kinase